MPETQTCKLVHLLGLSFQLLVPGSHPLGWDLSCFAALRRLSAWLLFYQLVKGYHRWVDGGSPDIAFIIILLHRDAPTLQLPILLQQVRRLCIRPKPLIQQPSLMLGEGNSRPTVTLLLIGLGLSEEGNHEVLGLN